MTDPYNTCDTTEIETIEFEMPDLSETQRIRAEIVRRLREGDRDEQ
jgi:hypothetical protein